jgi:hypothetical protein
MRTDVKYAGTASENREKKERKLKDSGYDFIDAIAAREPGAFVPECFGGVSGGAIWRFRDPFHADPPKRELKCYRDRSPAD